MRFTSQTSRHHLETLGQFGPRSRGPYKSAVHSDLLTRPSPLDVLPHHRSVPNVQQRKLVPQHRRSLSIDEFGDIVGQPVHYRIGQT
jgi:hypothetical protein